MTREQDSELAIACLVFSDWIDTANVSHAFGLSTASMKP